MNIKFFNAIKKWESGRSILRMHCENCYVYVRQI